MSLFIITGPMYSAKTTTLISKVTLHADVQENCKCLIINSSVDNRDISNIISSHSSSYNGLSPKIDVVSTDCLEKVDVSNYDIISIDEINFFTNIKESIEKWLNLNKLIYISGLDSDYMGNPFGELSTIYHMAEDIIKLKAICAICCKNNPEERCLERITKASFTGKLLKNDSLIHVGGKDVYLPMCRKHHKESIEKFL